MCQQVYNKINNIAVLGSTFTKTKEENTMSNTVPNVTFKTRVRDESIGGDTPFRWEDKTTADIFAGKSVVIVALPGAFTHTFSSTHLTGYEAKYEELKAKGIDEVYCVSVNDAFSMYQWSKQLGVEKVKMLPDGNGDFTRGMGMLVKKENLGFGDRSWRYSMHVVDGVVKSQFVEAGVMDNCPEDPFEVSDVDTMLASL
jgi:peroxiredoxin